MEEGGHYGVVGVKGGGGRVGGASGDQSVSSSPPLLPSYFFPYYLGYTIRYYQELSAQLPFYCPCSSWWL